MTPGCDILYAALAGLMHGGLIRNPARWAGLRHVAPLARWDRRETLHRQSSQLVSPMGWAEACRAVGALG